MLSFGYPTNAIKKFNSLYKVNYLKKKKKKNHGLDFFTVHVNHDLDN